VLQVEGKGSIAGHYLKTAMLQLAQEYPKLSQVLQVEGKSSIANLYCKTAEIQLAQEHPKLSQVLQVVGKKFHSRSLLERSRDTAGTRAH
jgi:hypothetical protein